MKLKILDTTDGKYQGETIEVDVLSTVGSVITHKGTSFEVQEIKMKGKYVTFSCANYIVLCEVIKWQ